MSFMLHISNEPTGVQQLCASEVLLQVAGRLCQPQVSSQSRTQADREASFRAAFMLQWQRRVAVLVMTV